MLIALLLHILGFTVWVGGMFFAYMALRPIAATVLEPAQRLTLWAGVLNNFFAWVWVSIAAILGSGIYMMALIGKPPVYVTVMFVIGIVMIALFGHLFFAPYRRLRRAVSAQDWSLGAAALGQIRRIVGINLILGLATICIAIAGRGYF